MVTIEPFIMFNVCVQFVGISCNNHDIDKLLVPCPWVVRGGGQLPFEKPYLLLLLQMIFIIYKNFKILLNYKRDGTQKMCFDGFYFCNVCDCLI